MNRQVLTYTDLEDICSCEFYDEIKDLPQITVTTDMQKAIQWYPRTNHGKHLFYGAVREFGQFAEVIYPDWKKPETLFRQSVIVSGILRKKVRDAKTDVERSYFRGFKRNCSMIVKAINMLEEACVQPDELLQANQESKDIAQFCEIWKEMLDEDFATYELHQAFAKLKDSATLRRTLREVFGQDVSKKILLHGFYFISPLQERFFRLLEDCGYQLVFLFTYNEQYPVAMQNWAEAYTQRFGFTDKQAWKMSGPTVVNPIGEMLEGRLETPVPNKVSIRKYRNTIEFAQAIKSDKDNGVAVYSPASIEANSILKEFYPEAYGERKLLSYPIGQFLIALHSVWDDDDDVAQLNADQLREIFASGWLTSGGVSSREYVRDLEAVLPYFDDCKTIPQWKKRLAYLQNVIDNAVEPFRKKSIGKEDARWIDVMGNPLAHFSMFSVEPDRLYEVTAFVENIAQIAEELFSGNQETSIAKHMSKLSSLVRTGRPAKDLLTEESVVVQELLHAIDRLRSKNLECDAGDIVSAIRLYLNGDLSDEEIDSDRLVGMVYPLSQIDAAAMKHGGKIHVCLNDGDNMPGTLKVLYWPLDLATLEECCEQCNNKLLDLIVLNCKNTPINNRYFMFSAFQNEEITLSWIEEMGAKKKTPSPYILMLQEAGQVVSTLETEYLSLEAVSSTSSATPIVTEFGISNALPKDVRTDYAVCPVKYLYSYVLEARPRFFNSFQQGHALGGLIQAIMTVMKEQRISKGEVAKQVFALFPHMRQVEKQQILDYINALPFDKGLWDEYGDYMYPPARMEISYPDATLREVANKKYSELSSQIGRKGMDLFESTDVKGACVYCPHADYCRNAIHALDQEDYYA